jgi:hypothetical protein
MSDPSHVDTGAEVDGTEADKINTGALGTLVAVGLLAMLSITAAVTALVRHDIEVEEATKDENANAVVSELKAKQRGALNGPAGYVDRGKGLVSLPIELAKGLVVGELERDPNSATPAPPPKPDAGAVEVSDAGVASDAAAPLAPAAATKPEAGHEVKTTPATSAKPSPVPTPTPTAATPGAQEPGPLNH